MSPLVVFFPYNKTNRCIYVKIIFFLHKIPHNSGMFRSLSAIFRELLHVTKAYIEIGMDNFNISAFVGFIHELFINVWI